MRGSLRYTVAGNIDVQTLLKDGKLKRPVAVEIEALGQQTLDVATYVREYIEGLNMVHGRLREALEPHLKRWKAEIRTAIAKYSDGGSNDVLGLEVAHLAEDGAVISRMALMEDLIRRSEELSRRNKTLGNLRKMFVSGELRKHKSRPTRST